MAKTLEVFSPGSDSALALESALETLTELGIERKDVWLGGGATLAARWGHREDRTVNLFVHGHALWPLLQFSLARRIRKILPPDRAERVEGRLLWARWDTGHGKVGVFGRNPWIVPWTDGTLESTQGIRVERPLSVLKLKTSARMWGQGEICLRDLHDIAACALHSPGTARAYAKKAMNTCESSIFSSEILFLDRATPRMPGEAGEAVRELNKAISKLMAQGAEPFIRRVRKLGREWLRSIPSIPRKWPREGEWRSFEMVELPPLKSFQRPCLQEEAPFRPDGFMSAMGKNMAGVDMWPTAEEHREWLRHPAPEELSAEVLGFMAEHLDKLESWQATELRQTCGASVADIARLAHAAKPHGFLFLSWLSRYAWRSAGDFQEPIEAYAAHGCRGGA